MKKYFFATGLIVAVAFLAVTLLRQWHATETRGAAHQQSGAMPSPPLVLSNLTIIDGRGGKPQAGQTVVIRDGRIAHGAALQRISPVGAQRKSWSGGRVEDILDRLWWLLVGLGSEQHKCRWSEQEQRSNYRFHSG